MNEIAQAIDGQDTDSPRDEKGECSLEQHVASDAATRSGNEQDGYALKVVGETWREIEITWRGPPVETASRVTTDIFIRRFHESWASHPSKMEKRPPVSSPMT